MREKLSSYISDLLDNWGLDPLYAMMIIVNVIMIITWKEIKNWRIAPLWEKIYEGTILFAVVFMNLFCLLRLIGVFDF